MGVEIKKSIRDLMEKNGIEKLNPVQERAIETGFLENRSNLVVASPTGSGKTFIAEMAILDSRKAVYTCPLKAIATEKYKEFQSMERMGKRIAISIGDLDSSDPWLGKYDVIVTTNEKLDSLMRHRAQWIKDVDLLIVDEIHLIDSDRGPTIESIIMKFKYMFPKTQIIALSATIPNAEEIADWLNAQMVKSNWRPVKLVKGVYLDGILETTDGTIEIEPSKDPLNAIVKHFLNEGKNMLIFTQTRKGAEATAERLGKIAKNYDFEESLAKKVLTAVNPPTKQCMRLSKCLSMGTAFHHAGLVAEQREIVEDAFRDGKIRLICATPTLAMGVNLPADVVIMKSLVRYTPRGLIRLPKREFFQCGGRAGRPGYSEKGLAILIARSENEKEILWEEYINGEPETVYSQFSKEPVLRSHVLSAVAMHIAHDYQRLNALFMNSFFAHQYGDPDYLMNKIRSVVEELARWGFVNIGEKITPTRLGARVSELYIDPYSARKLINSFSRDMGELGFIYAVVDTIEMSPYLSVKKKEEEDMWELALLNENELGFEVTSLGFEDYLLLDKIKTALMIKDWINEKTEEEILEKYNVAPGILRAYISNAEWMAYSASELARLVGSEKEKEFKKLMTRIRYGVKEELLPLIAVRGIGRIRARRLYNLGVKKVADIRKIKKDKLEKIIGKKLTREMLND